MGKSVRLQTDYMRTSKTRIILHGAPVDIGEDRIEGRFIKYGQVDKVSAVIRKSGFTNKDMILHLT